jgi:hypothetical protein
LTEFFPPVARIFATPRDLRLMMLVADWRPRPLSSSDTRATSLQPWFCFDIGERKFAIWRNTGKLYKVAHGAAGDDSIEIGDL